MPLAVVSGLHYAALTDCCWSADGRLLMVTSTDGYCSFFVLDDATLGETMPHSGKMPFRMSEIKKIHVE